MVVVSALQSWRIVSAAFKEVAFKTRKAGSYMSCVPIITHVRHMQSVLPWPLIFSLSFSLFSIFSNTHMCVCLHICLYYWLGPAYENEHVVYFLSEIEWPRLVLYILNPSIWLQILWLYFLNLNTIYINFIHLSTIYVHQIFITHSSIDEQLVWFQFFVIANKAAGVSCSNSLRDFSDWVRDKA